MEQEAVEQGVERPEGSHQVGEKVRSCQQRERHPRQRECVSKNPKTKTHPARSGNYRVLGTIEGYGVEGQWGEERGWRRV